MYDPSYAPTSARYVPGGGGGEDIFLLPFSSLPVVSGKTVRILPITSAIDPIYIDIYP